MAFPGLSSFRSFAVLLTAFLLPAAALVCWWGLQGGLTTTPAAPVPPATPGARTVDAIDMPHDEPDPPAGPHREAFQTSCTVCHSTRLVETQPPFPEKTWTEIVEKMVKAYGAPIPPPDQADIVQYLTATHSSYAAIQKEGR